jgi:exodeoxyribonuclease VII small subunit
MAKKEQKDDIKNLTFEQAIKELGGIVGSVEEGKSSLEESLGQYERGMALIQHCRDILQKAQKRIEKISQKENAKGNTEPSED